jgi:hypothetical protein
MELFVVLNTTVKIGQFACWAPGAVSSHFSGLCVYVCVRGGLYVLFCRLCIRT